MTDMTNASTWLGVRPVVNALGDIWDSCYVRFKEYTKETVEHLILAVFIYCVVCVLLYLGITKWNVVTFKSGVKNPKRVLFVIAHPDDECMFFGPTVLHFTRQPDCAVYLMCLSTGGIFRFACERLSYDVTFQDRTTEWGRLVSVNCTIRVECWGSRRVASSSITTRCFLIAWTLFGRWICWPTLCYKSLKFMTLRLSSLSIDTASAGTLIIVVYTMPWHISRYRRDYQKVKGDSR